MPTTTTGALLQEARLVVRGERIRIRPTDAEQIGFRKNRRDYLQGKLSDVEKAEFERIVGERFVETYNALDGIDTVDGLKMLIDNLDPTTLAQIHLLSQGPGSAGGRSGFSGAGGRLHKGVSLHKGLHKGMHKGLHKSADIGSGAASITVWPEILPPWLELGRLYEEQKEFPWNKLDDLGMLPKPRSTASQLEETRDILKKQMILRLPQNAWRRARIEIEATNDISAYMTPLGTDTGDAGSHTAVLFQKILWLGNVIGLYYKERFAVDRPHVLNPDIEPCIPVPAFYSYPSNHAFQSFLIAEVFARAVPEHSGVLALYRAAGQVAINREYAGLHFRSDTKAGQRLARLCAPVIEKALEQQILHVRGEWY